MQQSRPSKDTPKPKKEKTEPDLWQWLRERGFSDRSDHSVPIERPTRGERIGEYVATEYRQGTKFVAWLADEAGSAVVLLRSHWSSEDGAFVDRWTLLTKERAPEHQPGAPIMERFIMAKKKTAESAPKRATSSLRKTTGAAAANKGAGGGRAMHSKPFGKYSYCATSRALGIGHRSDPTVEPLTADVAAWIFRERMGITPKHPGSVAATLRDGRLTPAPLTREEWEQVATWRAEALAALGAASAAEPPVNTEPTKATKATKAASKAPRARKVAEKKPPAAADDAAVSASPKPKPTTKARKVQPAPRPKSRKEPTTPATVVA